jgi:hypothetical protein
MANTRTARSFSLAAVALIVAGVLYLLELLLSHVGVTTLDTILVFLSFLALAVAFLILFLWRSIGILLRVAFIVGAVGWALLALATIAAVGGGLVVIAEILALVGTLVAGIIVFVRHAFSGRADVAFLVLAIIAAILLFFPLLGIAIGAVFALILSILFGAMLVIAGLFISWRR